MESGGSLLLMLGDQLAIARWSSEGFCGLPTADLIWFSTAAAYLLCRGVWFAAGEDKKAFENGNSTLEQQSGLVC